MDFDCTLFNLLSLLTIPVYGPFGLLSLCSCALPIYLPISITSSLNPYLLPIEKRELHFCPGDFGAA